MIEVIMQCAATYTLMLYSILFKFLSKVHLVIYFRLKISISDNQCRKIPNTMQTAFCVKRAEKDFQKTRFNFPGLPATVFYGIKSSSSFGAYLSNSLFIAPAKI